MILQGKYTVFESHVAIATFKTKRTALNCARLNENRTVGLCFEWAGSTRITEMWDHTGRRLRFDGSHGEWK